MAAVAGKFFAIEGSDGSGKHTQSKLLVESLQKEGSAVELFSFPRYNKVFGKLVRDYLRGKFGSPQHVPVEFASLLYSLDRYHAKPLLEKALSAGKIVVADRFTASNIAHQAAKLSGTTRQEFIEWLNAVEAKLPKPALTIYLDVPVDVSQKLMAGRGEKDLHESNVSYLKQVRVVYLELAKQENWAKIDCTKDAKMLSIEEVHEMVWAAVKECL